MKVRNDFVSNSSSTSFIIYTDKLELSRLDERFFKLLGTCKDLYFSIKKDQYSKELVDEAVEVFKDKIDIYDDSIRISLKKFAPNEKKQTDIIKKFLSESKDMYCSYGCDDCGEYVGLATQVCCALELLYGIIPEGEDHFDYSSIKKLGVEL